MFLVLILTRGCVVPSAMERSEGDISLKNPVTPPRIDAGTVRLVGQHLNHYTTAGPSNEIIFLRLKQLQWIHNREIINKKETEVIHELCHHAQHFYSTILSQTANCSVSYKLIWTVSCITANISHPLCCKLPEVVALFVHLMFSV